MTADILRSLASRVEGLSGPDRSTDAAIVEALGWRRKGGFWSGEYWERNGERIWERHIPFCTASLDVAMTLVPEGWSVSLNQLPDECGDSRPWTASMNGPGPNFQLEGRSHAAAPAIAMTAAALRALAARIEARSDETLQAAQPEGREPDPKGDAHTLPGDKS